MIYDGDHPRVCPDQSIPQEYSHLRARPSLKNQYLRGNLEPREVQVLDLTPVRESDQGRAKLARQYYTQLMS